MNWSEGPAAIPEAHGGLRGPCLQRYQFDHACAPLDTPLLLLSSLEASPSASTIRAIDSMASSRSNSNSQTFSLLNQLTRSFDFLPQDLTKAFGDLRELDAVLRGTVTSLSGMKL